MKVPTPRGPLSEALLGRLLGGSVPLPARPSLAGDPLADDDFALALFCAHELSYGGLDGVSDEWEWEPELVAFRSALERAMLTALIERVGAPEPVDPASVPERIFALIEADEAPPLSRYLAARASLEQFREFVIHRSAYQLKEADPHTFAIPRIKGAAKSAMVEIQADEYGDGEPERMHSRLFARAMEELGLDTAYGRYVGLLPASTLSTVNLISLFSFRRRWRGALAGHLAAFEITSPQPNRRYANGLRRLGCGPGATEFFDEHVEADSVHENIAAYDMAGGLARQEPELAGDILFGVRCLLHCEVAFAGHLLDSFEAGRSSLLSAAEPAGSVAA